MHMARQPRGFAQLRQCNIIEETIFSSRNYFRHGNRIALQVVFALLDDVGAGNKARHR